MIFSGLFPRLHIQLAYRFNNTGDAKKWWTFFASTRANVEKDKAYTQKKTFAILNRHRVGNESEWNIIRRLQIMRVRDFIFPGPKIYVS